MTPRSGHSSFIFSKITPAITLSTNNRITLCSYYVQLSATLREQLRTSVDNVMRLFFDYPKICHIQWQGVPMHTWIIMLCIVKFGKHELPSYPVRKMGSLVVATMWNVRCKEENVK